MIFVIGQFYTVWGDSGLKKTQIIVGQPNSTKDTAEGAKLKEEQKAWMEKKPKLR